MSALGETALSSGTVSPLPIRRLVRPQTRNDHFGAQNNILPLTRIKPRLLDCETRDQVDYAILVPLWVASSSRKLKGTVVCKGIRLRTGRFEIRIPVGARDFPLFHNAQTSSGVRPALYSMRIEFFLRNKATGGVMLTARFHIESRLSWALQYRP